MHGRRGKLCPWHRRHVFQAPLLSIAHQHRVQAHSLPRRVGSHCGGQAPGAGPEDDAGAIVKAAAGG
jgi:hypothetical protein